MSKKEAFLVFKNMSSLLGKYEDSIYLMSEMDCDKEVRILTLVVLEKNILNTLWEYIEKTEILDSQVISVDN